MTRSISSHLYRGSFYLLMLGTGLVLLGGLYDIMQQVTDSSRGPSRVSDSVIAAGSYLSVGILAILISVSRIVTVRRTKASIPKAYLPIREGDVSSAVHRLVATEYTRVAIIATVGQPQRRTIPGYGTSDSPYPRLHFRTAIKETAKVLTRLIETHLTDKDLQQLARQSPRQSTLVRLAPFLFERLSPDIEPLVPPQYLPLLKLYDSHVDNARYRRKEPTQQEYEDCLRVLALLVAAVQRSRPASETADVRT
ncbi:uncharacterized protein L969DRAFT_86999 [Mixia osmundae IAM 14324]|uniref:Defect at low temperature protein 1 n=1 Tax=Mixia osmundae (strain CBS 9802 / IAM 14324 / JCM 22182 / KY 12970) TaxID=764103 RepID=G7EA07_MIXOS|nr:uncharacterized protein L969DRAFT_86999 [Mixia osmundae IAM 14324]KEI40354.1 hypothetical protein L969DRAFT_86999 [Mixia osmundae IAM 14324]GAA99667.1 hypothetical protein E5Q_06370 [Mixia osmundae IAM 14324]